MSNIVMFHCRLCDYWVLIGPCSSGVKVVSCPCIILQRGQPRRDCLSRSSKSLVIYWSDFLCLLSGVPGGQKHWNHKDTFTDVYCIFYRWRVASIENQRKRNVGRISSAHLKEVTQKGDHWKPSLVKFAWDCKKRLLELTLKLCLYFRNYVWS